MSTFDFTESGEWKDPDTAREIASALPRKRLITTGTILATESIDMGSSWCFRCRLSDHTGELYLLFMGRRVVAGLRPGTICTVEGTVGADGKTLTLWNPLYRIEAVE